MPFHRQAGVVSSSPATAQAAPGSPLTTYRPLTSADWDDRFSQAVIISAIVHVVFIFGLHFKAANPKLFESTLPIEVVLVNTSTADKPLKPTVLAQANVAGGGDVEEPRQRRSPLPVTPQDTPASAAEAQAPARVQVLERQAQQLMQQIKSTYSVPESQVENEPQPPSPTPTSSDLAARSLELARVEARVSKSWEEYQQRPRRMFEAPSAAKHEYAAYEVAFQRKVERYGDNNFPEALRRSKTYGAVKIVAEINSDGSVRDIQVERSSGNKMLDAAAIKTVYDAGPYGPFPLELRKHGDTINIHRWMHFTREDQLTASQ